MREHWIIPGINSSLWSGVSGTGGGAHKRLQLWSLQVAKVSNQEKHFKSYMNSKIMSTFHSTTVIKLL